MREYVEAGYKVIFCHSYNFGKYIEEVVLDYPNVIFMWGAGVEKKAPNAGIYYGRMYEAKFLVGIVAGSMTKTNKIGYAAGIEEGGRTGLTALIVAVLFFLGLFFSPFFAAVPPAATAPALIIVGLLMISPITKINFKDYTEVIPAFAVIALMSFTYNIGVGLCGGFVLFPLCKLAGGKFREVHPAAWVLFALCLLFFIFYPY
ncbi:BMP family ABC transporter substrate-binding protein [Patescibacteria group bacterium]|nr:BMP family ABC transporter substrate-binding protein [Patescibacteria group bacterium]